MVFRVAVTFLVMAGTACAGPSAGSRLSEANEWVQDQVEFDHGCPSANVRIIRRDKRGGTVDLDICGVVRRYKGFGTGNAGDLTTWLDVTTLYPAASLPQPLPPSKPVPER